jgi:transposase
LTSQQWQLLPDLLWHGPEAYGFRGNVWTCGRVAGAIGQEFGIFYSKSQVSRLLKRLEWTPQIPVTRAIQRDEEAIEQWRLHRWPALKEKARHERRHLIFVDESGFYLLPSVVKTYAPRGQTPLIGAWQTRDHLSVMGAVALDSTIYSLVRQESLDGLDTIAFLTHLLHLVGQRLLVIWDRSPIHWRAEVMAFLAQAGNRIYVEALPPYAPDLNPVEGLWQHLKNVEMPNLACRDVEELHMEFHRALGRTRQKRPVVQSFFEAAGLNV